MSPQEKEHLLLKLGLTASDVQELCGCCRSKAYQIMNICRKQYNGKAGVLTNAITPSSLCLALGTSLEAELRLIDSTKGKER